MRRQGQYADPGMNPMVAAQMQQHMSAQRLQQLSGNSQYSGRDPIQPGEDHQYNLSKMEGQWQWHRDGSKDSSELPPYAYNEGKFAGISWPWFFVDWFKCARFVVRL